MKRELMAILLVLGALLVIAAPALADEAGEKNKTKKMPVHWKATSPAIHKGDQYSLVMKNTGEESQKAQVHTIVMDHSIHTNTNVVDEQVELAPGEEREFTAVNDYGTANHFNTLIGSQTQNLALAVKVTDASGTETAQFNEKAFMVQEGKGGKGNGAQASNHTHDEGFVASVPAAFRDTARLSPLSFGVLAVAGVGLYAARRRWAIAGLAGGLAGPVALPPLWKAAAVGGLALSAALHIGLAPVHFEEAAAQGVFFLVAGVIAAIIAAAILVWPSRPAYLAGAGISLALIVLWAVFRIVPPPGAETAEGIDLVGLFTKATELVALTACTVLWLRARRTHQPDRALD